MARSGAYSLVLIALTACFPYGFTGGGLPSHIRTVAIVPFDNQTATPDLPRELTEALRATLHDRLGLRDASEAKATTRPSALIATASSPGAHQEAPVM